MLRKLTVLVLLAVFSFAVVFGQTKEQQERRSENKNPLLVNLFEGSYLGIDVTEVTKENFSKYGLREVQGVAIEVVLDDSPAKKAGLQNGDVILSFDGEKVTGVRKLIRLLSEVSPDRQVKLLISRNGKEQEVTVTLEKSPFVSFGNFNSSTINLNLPEDVLNGKIEGFPKVFSRFPEFQKNLDFGSRQIGVQVIGLSKQLGEYFGVANGKGLLISSVLENSPAAKAGLKAGDVILEVEGKEISDINDFLQTRNEKTEGDITLTIVRDKTRQTVTVSPEKIEQSNFPAGEIKPSKFMETLRKIGNNAQNVKLFGFWRL